MGNIIGWLTDEMSTGTAPTGTPSEQFHFYVPWAVFLALSFLVVGYYKFEARKRFFGSHALNKALLDRFSNHLAILATVGVILLLCRVGGVEVFGLRLWRYAWALWAVAFFGYWLYYLVAKYRLHLAAHNHQRMLQSYMPKPKPKGKAARV